MGVDRQLVERAIGGDHDAFARLAADAIDRMHAVARLILRDADDAEDATQEALVRAWRELGRLRDPERFEAWLRRLLVNACHDAGRRRRRQVTAAARVEQLRSVGPDGWHRVEMTDRLDRAFERLPIEQRTVLVLEHYLGLSGPEIAATVGIPLGTAKSRTRYATRAMRAALEADERELEAVG